jgi:TPR repeat protein
MGQQRIRVAKRAATAKRGEPDRLYRLGLTYSLGQGVPQDLVTAHKWLNLAAQRGSRQARDIRAEIARDMTEQQIAEAQRLAREWLVLR